MDPKSYASSKRSQRYLGPSQRRKSNSNGHSLRQKYQSSDIIGYMRISKCVYDRKYGKINENRDLGENKSTMFVTPFETKFLNKPLTNNLDYQLMQHEFDYIKNELENNYINYKNELNFDYVFSLKPGQQGPSLVNYTDKISTNRLYIVYINKNKIYNIPKNDEELNEFHLSRLYIRDSFYESMLYRIEEKEKKYYLNNWLKLNTKKYNDKIKCNVLSNYYYRILTNQKTYYRSNINDAHIHSFDISSYFRPSNDKNDKNNKNKINNNPYIIIEFNDFKYIEGISTKGKPLKRDKKTWKLLENNNIPSEYVTKYKLWIANDIDNINQNKKNDTTNGGKNKISKNKKNGNINECKLLKEKLDWKYLGIFKGNFDSETEVFHYLNKNNENTNIDNGIIAKYIRLEPIEYVEHKSLRIGFYGCDISNEENPKWVQLWNKNYIKKCVVNHNNNKKGVLKKNNKRKNKLIKINNNSDSDSKEDSDINDNEFKEYNDSKCINRMINNVENKRNNKIIYCITDASKSKVNYSAFNGSTIDFENAIKNNFSDKWGTLFEDRTCSCACGSCSYHKREARVQRNRTKQDLTKEFKSYTNVQKYKSTKSLFF